MSNFVEIRSSPAEIISIATGLSNRGADLVTAVSGICHEIEAQEREPKTFPSDQFTDPFVAQYKKVADATDGDGHPANEAVRLGAAYCGTKLTEIGDFVNKAMVNYEAGDQQGATEINQSAR
ncbi:hypothetical protein Aca07nite_68360 [Actinoplanes capillaceus]|uniref:Excreted virulence factor EspC, type VII ESX diderm n=1 Tax=Actinoplanes campanulatus TaxID=113559 RepID=A0ABQ3WTE4_9ACTN|nr:hypothetical protein [Actinoplanes capillaceus]GID49561.1 hypothetical protein Aca07nite_68360 [Actinoplanes capillaceus]